MIEHSRKKMCGKHRTSVEIKLQVYSVESVENMYLYILLLLFKARIIGLKHDKVLKKNMINCLKMIILLFFLHLIR